jgi:AraC-like DNA-binding protein/quercetin dioxygenase-like cupin family protein
LNKLGCTRIHEVKQHKVPAPGIVAMTLTSNHLFPRHSHDQFGIGMIVSGAQRSWCGTGRVDASAGDVVMLNPGEMHDGIPLGDGVRTWRMLYFEPVVVAQELSSETEGPIEILQPVVRDALLSQRFALLFACLTDLHSDPLAREENLLNLLVHVIRCYGGTRTVMGGRSPSVACARQRLDSAPELPISLTELAALAGVSRFQLLRGFTRELGITPHAYLVQRRVLLAQRLLASGQTPSQASMQAGFADQSHMTRAFLRQLGITPGRYQAAVTDR